MDVCVGGSGVVGGVYVVPVLVATGLISDAAWLYDQRYARFISIYFVMMSSDFNFLQCSNALGCFFMPQLIRTTFLSVSEAEMIKL